MPLNKITLKRQHQIEDIVQSILLAAGLSYPENSLIEIIKAHIPDVSIVESDFNGDINIRGAIFKKSKDYARPLIAVQSRQSAGAKTFALAHEFGHFALNHTSAANYLIDDQPFNGTRRMQNEGEANFFAASLLMPKTEFTKLDKTFLNDTQIAERFGVTATAVRVRREWLQHNGGIQT